MCLYFFLANSCLSRAGVIKPALFNTQRLKSMSHSVKSSKTTKGKILPDGSLRLEIRRGKPNLHHVETMDYEEFCVWETVRTLAFNEAKIHPKSIPTMCCQTNTGTNTIMPPSLSTTWKRGRPKSLVTSKAATGSCTRTYPIPISNCISTNVRCDILIKLARTHWK